MTAPVDLGELDLSLAAMLAGLAMAEEVERRVAAAGFDDVRFSHGFVFQHLVAGPLPVGALARRMGVTQQAASKAAGELERLGYLERVGDPDDGRVRRIALGPRGEAAVRAGREVREGLARELADTIGADRLETVRAALVEVLTAVGGAEAVRGRRVPGIR